MVKVSLEIMKQTQEDDTKISNGACHVKSGKKPHLLKVIRVNPDLCKCISANSIGWQGVLHRMYEQSGAKYHQLILPIEFRPQVMVMISDEEGHQACEHTLVNKHFY